jgi:dUTP pyrophosphatase
MKISIIRDVKTPERGTHKSAGIDFFVPNYYPPVLIQPGESILIPSGVKANVPTGYALIAFNKSGIASKLNLHVGACVVDEDYQGEIHLNLVNQSNQAVEINGGMKIIQFILLPVNYSMPVVVDIDMLYQFESERGSGGFGSTGN